MMLIMKMMMCDCDDDDDEMKIINNKERCFLGGKKSTLWAGNSLKHVNSPNNRAVGWITLNTVLVTGYEETAMLLMLIELIPYVSCMTLLCRHT